jgi:hypothetical protein
MSSLLPGGPTDTYGLFNGEDFSNNPNSFLASPSSYFSLGFYISQLVHHPNGRFGVVYIGLNTKLAVFLFCPRPTGPGGPIATHGSPTVRLA